MHEFIIHFDDKQVVRDWNDEYKRVLIDTGTRNEYVVNKNTGKPFMMSFATKVMIHDDTVALMFYLTFRDTIIYESAKLPVDRYA
jgi:class 3 adenylate cyclase